MCIRGPQRLEACGPRPVSCARTSSFQPPTSSSFRLPPVDPRPHPPRYNALHAPPAFIFFVKRRHSLAPRSLNRCCHRSAPPTPSAPSSPPSWAASPRRLLDRTAARFGRPTARDVAKLEAGVAISAALMPPFAALPAVSRAVYPAFEGHYLSPRPLPVPRLPRRPDRAHGRDVLAMASAVSVEEAAGGRLIYGANTLGAVGGVLVAGSSDRPLRPPQHHRIAAGVNPRGRRGPVARAGAASGTGATLEAGPEEEAPAPERNCAVRGAPPRGSCRWVSRCCGRACAVREHHLLVFAHARDVPVRAGGRRARVGADRDGRRGKVEFIGVLQLLVAVARSARTSRFRSSRRPPARPRSRPAGRGGNTCARSPATRRSSCSSRPFMGGILSRRRAHQAGVSAGLAGRLARIYTEHGRLHGGPLAVGFVLIPVRQLLTSRPARARRRLRHPPSSAALLAPANRWTVAATAAVCLRSPFVLFENASPREGDPKADVVRSGTRRGRRSRWWSWRRRPR